MGKITTARQSSDKPECDKDTSKASFLGVGRRERVKHDKKWGGFPGSSVVKNTPANEEDTWFGKIPHAVGQPSLWASATEPALQSPQDVITEPACHN